MPKRYSDRDKVVNRTQRKAAWRRFNARMAKYPDCAYGGDFFCNHVYDPAHPWSWVDFSFAHSSLKRYFAVAMVTCEYDAAEQISNNALEVACEAFPYEKLNTIRDAETGFYQLVLSDADRARYDLTTALEYKFASDGPVQVTESISIRDYGPVAVGVIAVVNTPFIDEHYIRRFISFFRELGEPTRPGWSHTGETVSANVQKYFTQTSTS